MLVAAAVCPCPPLLVPEVAAGAAEELAELRAACADAVGVLAAARPDRLVVVGPADAEGQAGEYPAGSRGSFAGYGVPLAVTLGQGAGGERELPSALAVGGWLLARVGWQAAPVAGLALAPAAAPQECLRAGREVARSADRVALLVLGDGSACRTLKAPGYLDPRAEGFDAAVGRALGAADGRALAGLDPLLAEELQVSGRAGWQLLAGAAEDRAPDGELLHDSAPYGVAYQVAAWS